ncbi:MAG TPA: AAA family ATPase [Candidatus Acidoferrum sp.]|nr:AAA family ATPase [Candidatus Acidoferrum sp.]
MSEHTSDSAVLASPSTLAGAENSASRIAYRVGGISFGVNSGKDMRLSLEPGIFEFEVRDTVCDVEIDADWATHLRMPAGKPLFESRGLWSAFKEDGGTAFYFRTDFLGEAPYKYAWFNHDFSRGRVHLLKRYFDPELPLYPLEYPLDELLMIHRISRGEGAEVHACGVVMPDGVGRLFIGHSGAGKSTTSRLWMAREGASVLSDDRIILRMANGTPFMYGTPWHGDAGLAAQASARVDRIYLLEHSPANRITKLDAARAAAELFARTFVPHHDATSLRHTLEFLETLTEKVSVSRFEFLPNDSAIEEILRAH